MQTFFFFAKSLSNLLFKQASFTIPKFLRIKLFVLKN